MTPITLPLRLHPADGKTSAPAAAWLLPGRDPAGWLTALSACGVAFDQVQICLIPTSASDRRPSAAMAVFPAGQLRSVAAPSLVQPYDFVAGRLLIPRSGRLFPPVGDAELAELLHYPIQVLHPSVGLIGFGRDEIVAASELLSPPVRIESDWSRAVPGVVASHRIKAILPERQPEIRLILRENQDDIGTASPEDLPPLPSEKPPAGVRVRAGLGMFKFLQWLAEHAPRLPTPSPKQRAGKISGPTPKPSAGCMNRLAAWSAARAKGMMANLSEARHREMNRLMEMLETDPDEGLKYAVPLRALPTRGTATPGANLRRRDMVYDPNAIQRAAPADEWAEIREYEQKLRTKYREAANRELALARYSRAAYIFAQLLGDFGAAANALRQGRFFREAAALYRDQIKDIPAAAECLEAGGLLLEAIPLYQQLGRFEQAGDLFIRIGQAEEARDAYLIAADRAVQAGNALAAAFIHEKKLADPDEAIRLLDVGLPDTHWKRENLREALALMGRHAKHEQASLKLQQIRSDPAAPTCALALAHIFFQVALDYPESGVRARAADLTRVVAGRKLQGPHTALPGLQKADATEARALVDFVTKLAAEDRLLVRDAQRFLETQPAPKPPPTVAKPAPPRPASKAPALARSFHLGALSSFKAVHAAGGLFYAVGVNEDHLITYRGHWDGSVQTATRRAPGAGGVGYCLTPFAPKSPALLAWPRRRRTAELPGDFSPNSRFGSIYLRVPPDLNPKTGTLYDAFVDERDTLWTLRAQDDQPALILSAYDVFGRLVSTAALDVPALPEEDGRTIRLAARDGWAFVLYGDRIFCTSGSQTRTLALRAPGKSLHVSNPHTRVRLAVTYDDGGEVFWPNDRTSAHFGQDLVDPACCFAADGRLVVVGQDRGMILRAESNAITIVGTFDHPLPAPAAIIAVSEPPGFAEFFHNGLVRLMTLPPATA